MTILYYDASGDCYSAAAGGSYVGTWSVEVSSSAQTVDLELAPRTGSVPPLSQALTSETKVPSGHAGDAVWSTAAGERLTITFDVPTATGVEWGWDYDEATLPVPLRLSVRVKRV